MNIREISGNYMLTFPINVLYIGSHGLQFITYGLVRINRGIKEESDFCGNYDLQSEVQDLKIWV